MNVILRLFIILKGRWQKNHLKFGNDDYFVYQNDQCGAGLDHVLTKLSYSLGGTEINL